MRSFKTFTTDLHRLADWLAACGIKSVAMEATGVYWIPVFEILEQRGLEVVLVNARHLKNVPGRKSDVMDCQWIQELHSVGLLRGSFRPEAGIASLRTYLRHREKLVQGAASHIHRMQKALVQMNLQLHNVISDITGLTGMRILRDIVAGVHDPATLAAHRDYRCRASEEKIAASLTGNYRAEHLFALRQNLELFDTFQRQIQDCDGESESGQNLERYHIIVDDIYIANIRFSPEYEKAIEAKQVAQQQVETQRQVLFQREIEAQQKVATAKGEAESILVVAQGQAKANEILSRAISPILVQYRGIEKWNGVLPQDSGGALPLIDLGKMARPPEEGKK